MSGNPPISSITPQRVCIVIFGLFGLSVLVVVGAVFKRANELTEYQRTLTAWVESLESRGWAVSADLSSRPNSGVRPFSVEDLALRLCRYRGHNTEKRLFNISDCPQSGNGPWVYDPRTDRRFSKLDCDQLAKYSTVTLLTLSRSEVDLQELAAALKKCRRLKILRLPSCSREGFENLAVTFGEMANLGSINVQDAVVSEQAAKCLAKVTTQFELYFENLEISPEALEILCGAPNLGKLVVRTKCFTAEHGKAIARSPLKRLIFRYPYNQPNRKDSCRNFLEGLKTSTALEQLFVEVPNLTIDDYYSLAEIPSLRGLHVSRKPGVPIDRDKVLQINPNLVVPE